MDRPKLRVEKRSVEGRRVRALRRDGILPANVFGKNVKSFSVQLPVRNFEKTYDEVGETGLIDLQVDGEIRPVLVSNVQYHPVTDLPLHADFRQVDLKEKIQAAVPVEVVGESPAEKTGVGILVQQMNEIEVEALPTDLPEKIVVDVGKLENVDDAIHVKDLAVDRSKVILSADEEEIVVKIEPPAKEEEIAPVAVPAEEGVEGAEGIPERPEGEGAPAEGGETPTPEVQEKSGEKENK